MTARTSRFTQYARPTRQQLACLSTLAATDLTAAPFSSVSFDPEAVRQWGTSLFQGLADSYHAELWRDQAECFRYRIEPFHLSALCLCRDRDSRDRYHRLLTTTSMLLLFCIAISLPPRDEVDSNAIKFKITTPCGMWCTPVRPASHARTTKRAPVVRSHSWHGRKGS